MPAFAYQAVRMSDKMRISGVINAENERLAREMLREQDMVPTQMKVVHTSRDGKANRGIVKEILSRLTFISIKDVVAFSRNLGMMVRSGIPLTDALMYLESYMENGKFRAVVGQMRRDILAGQSFSSAMAKHPKVFNEVFVNVVRAGETSGELDVTLERMTNLLLRAEKLKAKIITASVYPAIVLTIVTLVLLVIFLFVIPTFQNIYKEMNVELPLITQILIGLSDFLRNYWFIAFPGIGFSIWGSMQYIQSEGGKSILDGFILKIPVLGNLMKYVNNSNFFSTLHVSFSAGIPVTQALDIAASTVQNTYIRSAFMKVNVQIQAGQKLALSLSQTGYVPDLVQLMISTGEESGELDKMLENSYEYLEKEIDQRIDVLTTMMEPCMLIVLGVVVGGIALAIYLPLFSMYEHM
jgi:type II secretory pathway component PulF